jgi:Phosphate/sulphate permeases
MLEIPILLVVIVLVALIFDFTNGAHDCANAIATVVSTKVMSPRSAVIMAASLNLFGALLGEEVAHTLGSGIVNTEWSWAASPCPCGPCRGHRLESYHLVFRDSLLVFPCAHRRAHGRGPHACGADLPERHFHRQEGTAAFGHIAPLPVLP